MNNGMKNGSFNQDLQRQREFIEDLKKKGFHYPLIAADAFVRGMRDSGYKSTATAIDELVDNAIQAQATKVDVMMGYASDNPTKKKFDYIAAVDNGHGMDPEMIRVAVVWGGTHRENDRTGFGRYGFGLSSASVSVAERFTVYSRVPGGGWHYVTIDLKDVAAGKLTDKKTGATVAPEAKQGEPPASVLDDDPENVKNGTVVLLEKLDRLTPGFVTSSKFQEKMLEHLGLYYRGVLRNVRIRVIDTAHSKGAKVVEPVDPLFLTPGARYHDEHSVMAEALPDAKFTVTGKQSGEAKGTVRIRYSYLPYGFQKDKKSGRFHVMKENNGIIMMRAGRQIDVIMKTPFLTFVNYDRNWKAEIDFEPTLDEYFGVTTNKQQIVISEAMWDILKDKGLNATIKALRKRFREDKAKAEAAAEAESKRASEETMKEAQKYRTRKRAMGAEKEKAARKRLEEEITRRAKETGRPPDEIRAELEETDFQVKTESMPGAPFYRMEQIGGVRILWLNTAHRFFTDVYNGPTTSPHVRSALELLLFVLGESELTAEEELERFYQRERAQWSTEMELVLDILDERAPVEDEQSALDQELEDEEAEADANAPQERA